MSISCTKQISGFVSRYFNGISIRITELGIHRVHRDLVTMPTSIQLRLWDDAPISESLAFSEDKAPAQNLLCLHFGEYFQTGAQLWLSKINCDGNVNVWQDSKFYCVPMGVYHCSPLCCFLSHSSLVPISLHRNYREDHLAFTKQ